MMHCALALVPLLMMGTAARARAQAPALPAGADSVIVRSISDLPVVQPPHPRGGRALAIVFGDSTDHLKHNTINLVVSSGVTLGVLWLLPEHVTYWYRDKKPTSRIRDAFIRPPVWDNDPWVFNYIGHPVAGMHVYLMERNWGTSAWRSFLFGTASSFGWEYLIEGWMERPSIQDLLITSPSGWLLGEGAYQLTMLLRRDGYSLPEKAIVLIVNPLYVMQHGYR